ncbi:MAG: hypothetical protein K5908_05955 [Erysipelotrichaceae bacterium]|nr:hypothetical protein [Erysipelotrichaceae bacterium]
MIRKDNQKFNDDDWLAREIARESRISAWDLDEGKKVRAEHEENCDVRELAEEHHRRHLRRDAQTSRVNGKLSGWFFIDIAAVVAMFMFNVFLPTETFLAPILLFLALNPGIFVWIFLAKRLPSDRYLKTVLLIAVIIEIYELFIRNYRYISYLIWRYL